MSSIKVWPHMTIVAIICALVAGLGVAFWLKHEQTVSAESLPNAARIQRVDGEVALNNGLYENGSDGQWVTATPNMPFSVGDRIYTQDNSRTSLAFSGRNFARLNPNSSLDVISLADRRTQLALRDGSAIFDVGYLAPNELFEVATPYGAVDFDQPGLYNVGLNNGSAIVSVLSGLAQVVGLGGSGQISKGEMLTLAGQTAAQMLLSRIDGRNAGYLVNDYYASQYPNSYDGRYSSYDAYLSDPNYYDPSRQYNSYQYVSNTIPGFYDLDSYGNWQNVDGYGNAWSPRVDSGWAPYQQGSWVNDYPYGMTWVSSEPWGYAPYHYGRWANVNNQWFWIPDTVNTTPSYAPALVAFVPFSDGNQIGWVPLGPGDPYAPRYYDANWQPYYLTRTNVVQTQLVNLNVPGAVAYVPIQDLGRAWDPRSINRANPQMLAQVRPVLDPLTLTPLRNAVVHSAWGRGKIDLPPGIAKKLYDTPVITSSVPNAPPFRKDLAKALRVEAVPERAKGAKLQIRDERGERAMGQTTNPDNDQARKQKIDQLADEAAKGNRDARRQMHDLQQQQRQADVTRKQTERAAMQQQRQQQVEQQRAQRSAIQQARGEAVGHRERPQPQQAAPRARQDVPHAREPQARPQVMAQPQPRAVEPPRGRQDVPRAREPQGRVDVPRAQPQPRAAQPQPQPQAQRPAKPEKQQGPPAGNGQSQGGGGGKGHGKKP
ncbi:MAG: FecR family protein [bacterium]